MRIGDWSMAGSSEILICVLLIYLQVQYMIVVTCHASVYTLVLMSFDRFLAVVHPVTSMSLRTEHNATL